MKRKRERERESEGEREKAREGGKETKIRSNESLISQRNRGGEKKGPRGNPKLGKRGERTEFSVG